jgi:hypothetical protein
MDFQHKLTQVTIFEAAMAPQIGVDGALHRARTGTVQIHLALNSTKTVPETNGGQLTPAL